MKVVIMAGGKGTRIATVAADIPKPMIKICGKPILEHQIENLKVCGLTDIILVIGHLGEVIQEYFGDGAKWGVNRVFCRRTSTGDRWSIVYDATIDRRFLIALWRCYNRCEFQPFYCISQGT